MHRAQASEDFDNPSCNLRDSAGTGWLGNGMASRGLAYGLASIGIQYSQDKSGDNRPSRAHLVLALSVVLWVSSGMAVLCHSEGLHWISAAYVLVQMITSIGYGDITVQTSDGTKAFLSFYVLFCCVIVSEVVFICVNKWAQAAQQGIPNRMANLEKRVRHPSAFIKDTRCLSPFMWSLVMLLTALVVGTCFFAFVEKCTCSYSESRVEGCDPEDCEATGGYTKSLVGAWYMSCVSLTTIGFGDVSPKSAGGRIFGVIWMLGGVAAFLNVVEKFTHNFIADHQVTQQLQLDINKVFSKIDRDDNGTLDRFEFMTFALLEYGILGEKALDAINAQFDDFDQDGNGQVTKEEICQRYTIMRDAQATEFNDRVVNRASVMIGISSPLDPVPVRTSSLTQEQQQLQQQRSQVTFAESIDSIGVGSAGSDFMAPKVKESSPTMPSATSYGDCSADSVAFAAKAKAQDIASSSFQTWLGADSDSEALIASTPCAASAREPLQKANTATSCGEPSSPAQLARLATNPASMLGSSLSDVSQVQDPEKSSPRGRRKRPQSKTSQKSKLRQNAESAPSDSTASTPRPTPSI